MMELGEVPSRTVVVVGHSALDHVYRVAELPARPVKTRALEHIVTGGGMAANAAVAIARLGGAVELWSRVGGDLAGQQILAQLAAEGVDTRCVRVCPGARSSTSAIIVDGRGERIIVGERDHAMAVDAGWLPLGRIATAGAVLSDLRWYEATRAAFSEARRSRVATVLDIDLGGGDHVAEFLPLSDYAIFSAPALDLFAPGRTLEHQLRRVLDLGVRHAGVTQGAGGYTWLDGGGDLRHQPAFAVSVVDTTGAGDAFHGAFAWGVARGETVAECARIASATAALACRRLGARVGMPSHDELAASLAGSA